MSLPKTASEKLAFAEQLKEEGNVHFKAGDYAKALSRYTKMFAYITGLEVPPEAAMFQTSGGEKISTKQTADIRSLTLSAHLNCSLCYLKLQRYNDTIKACNKALAIDNSNAKAVFRIGQAYLAMGNLDGAEKQLKQALAQCPDDPAIKRELQLLQQKLHEHEQKERKLYAGAFDRINKQEQQQQKS